MTAWPGQFRVVASHDGVVDHSVTDWMSCEDAKQYIRDNDAYFTGGIEPDMVQR